MALTKEEVLVYIKSLSSVELVEFTKDLQSVLGVSLPEPLPEPRVVIAGGMPIEEMMRYQVKIHSLGPNKIEAIKELRAITGSGFGALKAISEHLPYTIETELSEKEAKQWVKRLEASGATAEIKEYKP